MQNRVTEMLGCKFPVIQGAMGIISNPEMVAAVSNAGGFGLLATAFADNMEIVHKQVTATRELTDKPFGANLFMMNPLSEEFARLLADEGVKAVTLSGGSPKALLPVLHDLGISALVVVPTTKVALSAAASGADAIVAEGSESGGIQGLQGASTMVLTPAVVDAVDIPVIAAGGIGDSRGYRAALALGAEGVQVGTRFIATRECVAHTVYKDIIVQSAETGTELLDVGRMRVRALNTPLVQKITAGEDVGNAVFGEAMEESWLRGDIDAGVLPAGQISGLVSGVATVKDIVEEMVGVR
ncbi:MAG: nitronate monooxygenase [Deltaproteobacteria bacterium]|jgi:enoyl-[acyl-carrier protein] reductase II|nr:nitronate monooxygenase [Deltaproteobacteria bacterium]